MMLLFNHDAEILLSLWHGLSGVTASGKWLQCPLCHVSTSTAPPLRGKAESKVELPMYIQMAGSLARVWEYGPMWQSTCF